MRLLWWRGKNGEQVRDAKERYERAVEKREEVRREVTRGEQLRRINHISEDVQRVLGGQWRKSY